MIVHTLDRRNADPPISYYALFVAIAFTLSLFFPLIILVINPIVFGIPHLLIGLFTQGVRPKYQILSSDYLKIVILGWVYFLTAHIVFNKFGTLNFLKIVQQIGVFGILAKIVWDHCHKRTEKILRFSFSILVIISFWVYPLETAGLFVIGHHFIALINWIVRAPNAIHRKTAIAISLVFSILNIAILFGLLDSVINWHPSNDRFFDWPVTIASAGKLIWPRNIDPTLMYRLAVIWAFGQSVHYFIWLKVLPAIQLKEPISTLSFEGIRLLRRELGDRINWLLPGVTLLAIAGFFLFDKTLIFLFYSVFAGFHSYLDFVLAGTHDKII